MAGHYSETGYEPCVQCPRGSFQTLVGSTGCDVCPDLQSTLATGSQQPSDCRGISLYSHVVSAIVRPIATDVLTSVRVGHHRHFCVSVCVCAHSVQSSTVCVPPTTHQPSPNWRLYALSERLLVLFLFSIQCRFSYLSVINAS